MPQWKVQRSHIRQSSNRISLVIFASTYSMQFFLHGHWPYEASNPSQALGCQCHPKKHGLRWLLAALSLLKRPSGSCSSFVYQCFFLFTPWLLGSAFVVCWLLQNFSHALCLSPAHLPYVVLRQISRISLAIPTKKTPFFSPAQKHLQTMTLVYYDSWRFSLENPPSLTCTRTH